MLPDPVTVPRTQALAACDSPSCPNRIGAGEGRTSKTAALRGADDLGALLTVGKSTIHVRCARLR